MKVIPLSFLGGYMCTISFKERVRNEAIANAKLYKENFVDYEYLICSQAFEQGFDRHTYGIIS